jgi:hypothetical protein
VQAQQNLVPNPSFEVIDTSCIKDGGGAFWYASHMVGWWPALNSMDYFADTASICLDTFYNLRMQSFAQPHSMFAYNLSPASGNKYAGACAFYNTNGQFGTPANFREQIECALIASLQINHFYKVSFKIAFQSPFSVFTTVYPPKSTTNIGIKFTNARYMDFSRSNTTDTLPSLNIKPDIKPLTHISDTTWVEVSGIFQADSNYKYMILGAFGLDNLVDTLTVPNGLVYFPYTFLYNHGYTYYFFDDIKVLEMDTTMNQINAINPQNFKVWIYNDEMMFNNNVIGLIASIYDQLGNLVSEIYVRPGTSAMDLKTETNQPGLYFIKISNNNQNQTLKYIRYE